MSARFFPNGFSAEFQKTPVFRASGRAAGFQQQ
jgi:hypothetical protein